MFCCPEGIPYQFGGMPYYLATINNTGPDALLNFFILGTRCGQAGLPTLSSDKLTGEIIDTSDVPASPLPPTPPLPAVFEANVHATIETAPET